VMQRSGGGLPQRMHHHVVGRGPLFLLADAEGPTQFASYS
jgi:hypothetical protein